MVYEPSLIISEIKFGKVALQVSRAAMLIDAEHPALEDAEKPFDRVGMSAAAHVFASPMLDREVIFELLADGVSR